MPLESRLVVQRFQPFLLLLSTIDSLHQRIVLHLRRLEVFYLLIPILALALFLQGRRIDRIPFGRNVFLAKRFAGAVVSVANPRAGRTRPALIRLLVIKARARNVTVRSRLTRAANVGLVVLLIAYTSAWAGLAEGRAEERKHWRRRRWSRLEFARSVVTSTLPQLRK